MSRKQTVLEKLQHDLLPLYPTPASFLRQRLGLFGASVFILVSSVGAVYLWYSLIQERAISRSRGPYLRVNADAADEARVHLQQGLEHAEEAQAARARVDPTESVETRWNETAFATGKAIRSFQRAGRLAPLSPVAAEAELALGELYIDAYLLAGMSKGDTLEYQGVVITKWNQHVSDGDQWGDLEERVVLQSHPSAGGPADHFVVDLRERDFTLRQLVDGWREDRQPVVKRAGTAFVV